jgi:hypothetical protein
LLIVSRQRVADTHMQQDGTLAMLRTLKQSGSPTERLHHRINRTGKTWPDKTGFCN